MSKLLIVEDDVELAKDIGELLISNGHLVEIAYNGFDGLLLLRNFNFDLVVLDWNLPDTSGIEILKQHRRDGGETLVLFLTGESHIDREIEGLDSGADDYLTKPFQPRELLARIRTLLRRPKSLLQSTLIIGPLVLDRKMRALKFTSKSLSLSKMEFLILERLMAHPNQIFSSKELFTSLWESQAESSEQTVRVHVRVIRKKLSDAGFPACIQSAAGGGWFIAD